MGLTHKQKMIVVILLAGAVLAVLNQTLLSPAFPTIMADLHVDATTVQWLTSAYSLVEAVIIPLSAYLIGRFSTRKLFIAGISIFAFGSLLAAFAPFFAILLLGRVFQAIACGIVMPMVFTVILLIFPREKRGSAMGMVSLVIGFAPAVGPSVSGILVDGIGWRALFVVVFILALIIIIASIITLESYGEFEPSSFDKPSVALCSLGLLSLLYGLSSISSARNITLPLALIAVGAVLLFFFVRRQFKLEIPLLRIEVLKTHRYAITVIVIVLLQAALVGTGVLLPIYLQNLIGVSALQTGLIMLPGAVIGAFVGFFAGRLFDRIGPRKVILPGAFISFVGGLGLVALNLDTPIVFIICVYTCLSVGMQAIITPLNTWGINSLDNKVIQHANALSNTLNQVGASLGTAVLVSLSATSTFLFPEMPTIEQTMAGDKIAFCFTASIILVIFVIVLAKVRDAKTSPLSTIPVHFPTKADDNIAVNLAMNSEPYYVHSTDSIRSVAQILASNKTSGVPIVDNKNKVVGFVSDGDIMKYIGRNDAAILDGSLMLYRVPDDQSFVSRVAELLDLNVMRIATKNVISVDSGSELDKACRLLAEKRIKKAPVVDEKGILIGSLSRSDIIRSTMANLASIEAMAAAEKLEKRSQSCGL
ncbi:drug resistance transporter EmrB/QacA subfamily [Eggerthella sp. CAG:368]|nr:drug resistance transporter EmrB/QacA subfamily [Eggerthella sp. CAG:368]